MAKREEYFQQPLPMKSRRRIKADRRLIKAAERELLLVHKEHTHIRSRDHHEEIISIVALAEKRDDPVEERPAQEDEDGGFLGRCNISCVDLSPGTEAIGESGVSAAKKTKEIPLNPNRSVMFHRYDEVIDENGGKNYIYSLYDLEEEEERNNRDLANKVEEKISDFGYFFKVLGRDLAGAAAKRKGAEENNPKKKVESVTL